MMERGSDVRKKPFEGLRRGYVTGTIVKVLAGRSFNELTPILSQAISTLAQARHHLRFPRITGLYLP